MSSSNSSSNNNTTTTTTSTTTNSSNVSERFEKAKSDLASERDSMIQKIKDDIAQSKRKALARV